LLEGTVEYRQLGSEEWFVVGDAAELSVGDRVRTGDGSTVAVQFEDGSVITLEPDAEVEIQNYESTRDGDRVLTRVARIALIEGFILADVREDLIFPPSVFEIVTEDSIIPIQGILEE
jgi:ferric-dicitrate binding protein FerR (iron transport regulator)